MMHNLIFHFELEFRHISDSLNISLVLNALYVDFDE